jgi:hypothetical protein
MKAGAGITEVERPIHPFLGFADVAKVVFPVLLSPLYVFSYCTRPAKRRPKRMP